MPNPFRGAATARKNIPDHVRAPFTQREDTTLRATAWLPKHVPIYLPEIHPIPSAQEFNPSAFRATAAVETQIFTLTPDNRPSADDLAGAITLPPGNIGIIRSVTISITDMLTTTDVSFTLFINGGPVGGYGGLKMTPRVSPYVSNSFDTFIRVPDRAKIQVGFSNIDGGTYVVGCAIGGWFWPIASGTQWLQTGSVG